MKERRTMWEIIRCFFGIHRYVEYEFGRICKCGSKRQTFRKFCEENGIAGLPPPPIKLGGSLAQTRPIIGEWVRTNGK